MASPPVQPPVRPTPASEWPHLPMSELVRMRDHVVSVVQPANQQAAAALAVLAWTWAQERAELHARVLKRTAVNPLITFSMLRSSGIACLHDLALATWNLPASNPILYEALHDVALPTQFQSLTLFVQPSMSPNTDSPVALPRHLLERIVDCGNSRVLSWAELDGHRRHAHSEPPRDGPGVLFCPRTDVEAGPLGLTFHWLMPIVRHHLELVEQPPQTVNLGMVPTPIFVRLPATESTSAAPRLVTFPTLSASMLLTYELVRLRQYLDPRALGSRFDLDSYERQAYASVCVFNIFLLGQIEQEALRAEAQQGPQVQSEVAGARTSCRLDDFRRVARSYLAAAPEFGSVDTFFEWLRELGSTQWRSSLPEMHHRAGHICARISYVLSRVHDLAHPIDGPVAGPSVYEPQPR
ncbi:hypothetical protein JCM9279_007377 [Rhodotorula babjevae]